jgi:sarcosine oxidase subunit beta
VSSDLLVVGGGITGLALAVHAARAGLQTTLVDAGPLGGQRSTQQSGALIRTHYADASSAALALEGLEHFETFEERYGASAGFTRTGFAYVPEPHEDLGARIAMLQAVGVETELRTPGELRSIDAAVRVEDAEAVAWEPRSGYASPALTCAALAGAAVAAGAVMHERRPVERLLPGGGARLRDGAVLEAGRTVLCAGAASAELAATVGLDLPLQPTAVKLAVFERHVETHLAVIDAPNGTYLRPDGVGGTLVGRRTWTDEPLARTDSPLPAVDDGFVADARERLVRRLPGAAGARVLSTRAGMLDMTPDGLPLVGPTNIDGLWCCCGWSGTGFKTGPSVGAALAGWLNAGEPPAELRAFDPHRAQLGGIAVRSPH